jgi:two-component system, LuxR family, response regulator FixJ
LVKVPISDRKEDVLSLAKLGEDELIGLPASRPAKIYIVDDDASVRKSTAFLLASAGFGSRSFVSGVDFLESAPDLPPGLVLLDLRMPQMDGLGVLNQIMQGDRRKFEVVVITGHGDLPTAVQAMKAGARDFLEKPYQEASFIQLVSELLTQLEEGANDIAKEERCRAAITGLTCREREVLCLLADGQANKSIANRMGLSVRTVEMHRGNMLNKLKVKTVAEAVRIAFEGKISLSL